MDTKNKFYLSARFVLVILTKLLFKFQVKGKKNIPKQSGCIIAANHLSYLDPIVLSIACPRILNFMAKQELFKGWFGRLIKTLNAFAVQRGRQDLKAMRFSLNLLKTGKTLIIFPEGKRSSSGIIGKASSGVGMLAAKTGVDVVPTLITGTNKVMPVGRNKITLFQSLSVCFGKPLNFKEMNLDFKSKHDYQYFADCVLESIKDLQK